MGWWFSRVVFQFIIFISKFAVQKLVKNLCVSFDTHDQLPAPALDPYCTISSSGGTGNTYSTSRNTAAAANWNGIGYVALRTGNSFGQLDSIQLNEMDNHKLFSSNSLEAQIYWRQERHEGKMFIFQSQGEHLHDLSLSKATVGLRTVPRIYALSAFFSTNKQMSLLWNFSSLASQWSN